MHYRGPVDSLVFLIKDVLKVDNELTEAVISEAAKYAEEVVVPTNSLGDEGCVLNNDGTVSTPESFKKAYSEFAAGGWIGLDVPEQYGGQGQPGILSVAVNEIMSSANMALSMYPGLTRGAIEAILTSGTEEQKQEYIPNMVSGKWTGTMNLTEPHCGTDLGLLKTKATRNTDGSFSITGQKIFISCGEHDMSENIVHLVLARIEGSPAGTKGISMFIVPKLINGQKNDLSCGSIEEKMGIHGSSTCVMNYDGAKGYLIGEENKGLNAMFVMMNSARLNVAVQGLSQSELAYQNALQYAKERVQSAQLTDPKGGSVTIINHPDVRRMLMDIRCVNEAARLVVLEAALLCEDKSEAAQDRLGLLTPILKGVLTDYGFENAVKAQQVFGGHGYIKEWGIEQIVRDARICQIYEGTNGVQALDLVGRKLPKNMGRAVRAFFKDTEAAINSAYDNNLHTIVQPLTVAVNELKLATEWLAANALKNPNNAGSASYSYMKMFGLVLLGMSHVKICMASDDKARHVSARYFMENILPETGLLLQRIKSGSETMMELAADEF